MNILNLNLLPPAKKKRLEQTVRFLFVKQILEMVIIVYSILGIATVTGWLVIQEHFTYLSNSAIPINREYSSHNKNIGEVNAVIKALALSKQEFVPLAPVLLDIIASTPPSIKFNTININRENGNLTIAGVAKDRVVLLIFQDTFKKIPWLKMGESPLSPLLQKENINFELTAEITSLPVLAQQRPAANSAHHGDSDE